MDAAGPANTGMKRVLRMAHAGWVASMGALTALGMVLVLGRIIGAGLTGALVLEPREWLLVGVITVVGVPFCFACAVWGVRAWRRARRPPAS